MITGKSLTRLHASRFPVSSNQVREFHSGQQWWSLEVETLFCKINALWGALSLLQTADSCWSYGMRRIALASTHPGADSSTHTHSRTSHSGNAEGHGGSQRQLLSGRVGLNVLNVLHAWEEDGLFHQHFPIAAKPETQTVWGRNEGRLVLFPLKIATGQLPWHQTFHGESTYQGGGTIQILKKRLRGGATCWKTPRFNGRPAGSSQTA